MFLAGDPDNCAPSVFTATHRIGLTPLTMAFASRLFPAPPMPTNEMREVAVGAWARETSSVDIEARIGDHHLIYNCNLSVLFLTYIRRYFTTSLFITFRHGLLVPSNATALDTNISTIWAVLLERLKQSGY